MLLPSASNARAAASASKASPGVSETTGKSHVFRVHDALAQVGVDVVGSVFLHQLQRIASRVGRAHIQGQIDDIG